MYVKIDDDQFHDLIARDLKSSLIRILEDPYPLYHDVAKSYELVVSMLNTLSYYIVETECIEFENELFGEYEEFFNFVINTEKNSFEIENVDVNEDGSLNVTFDVSGEENINDLIENGAKYKLILAALECDDDTLVKWALRGKEEGKIDNRVREELAKRGL